MISEKEVKDAIELSEYDLKQCKRPDCEPCKKLRVLVSLASLWLGRKWLGMKWPEKRTHKHCGNICKCDYWYEYNSAIDACRLASVVSEEEILKVLEEITYKQFDAIKNAVDKNGLMNTDWEQIDNEGGSIDFKTIAHAIAEYVNGGV